MRVYVSRYRGTVLTQLTVWGDLDPTGLCPDLDFRRTSQDRAGIPVRVPRDHPRGRRVLPVLPCYVCWGAQAGYVFFFFQAEDGIRDDLVTGVQTCALPISLALLGPGRAGPGEPGDRPRRGRARRPLRAPGRPARRRRVRRLRHRPPRPRPLRGTDRKSVV